jgi:hypothetical protein
MINETFIDILHETIELIAAARIYGTPFRRAAYNLTTFEDDIVLSVSFPTSLPEHTVTITNSAINDAIYKQLELIRVFVAEKELRS